MEKTIVSSSIAGLLSDSNQYETSKGKISMLTPCKATMDMFEIYCLEGDLFEDIERFSGLEDVEARISELLEG